MKLFDIVKADSAYLKDITITMDICMGTVEIADDREQQESIFLQGDDADRFIGDYKTMVEKSPNSTFWDIERYLARPFVDCIWN